MKSNYHIVKLSNGDDIICSVVPNNDIKNEVKITAPLKMETISKVTDKGIAESLGLSRWIQPYTDQPYFSLEKTSIVVMAKASIGLSRYYEYVLKRIGDVKVPAEMKIEEEIEEETEKLLANLTTETIH